MENAPQPGETARGSNDDAPPSRRRRLWGIGALVLLALVLIYLVSPAVSFYRIARAVEAGDGPALASRVDFPALRKSLQRQIVDAYMETAERKLKKRKLSLIEQSLGHSFGRALADGLLVALVHDGTLLDLLRKGEAKGAEGLEAQLTPSAKEAPFANIDSARRAVRFWWSTEYRGFHYYAYVPANKPHEEQFRVQLTLRDWSWKLSGLELPRSIRARLARKAFKQQDGEKD